MREGAGEEEEEEEEEEKGGEAKRAKLLYDFGRACYERPALVDTCTSPEVEEGKVMEVEEGRRRGHSLQVSGCDPQTNVCTCAVCHTHGRLRPVSSVRVGGSSPVKCLFITVSTIA